MNADWNSKQKHIASSFLFSFSKLTSSRVAPPTAIITPTTCSCCFPGFGNCTSSLVQQPREQAEEEHAQRQKRRTGNRKTVGEERRYSVCQRGRSASLAKWRPLEIRSVSGAADHDSLCDVPIPRRYGLCQGPISVLLESAHCPTAGCGVLVRG